MPRSKRIGHFLPAGRTQRHFHIREQAAIQRGMQSGKVDVLPDKDQLLPAVTDVFLPFLQNVLIAFFLYLDFPF